MGDSSLGHRDVYHGVGVWTEQAAGVLRAQKSLMVVWQRGQGTQALSELSSY